MPDKELMVKDYLHILSDMCLPFVPHLIISNHEGISSGDLAPKLGLGQNPRKGTYLKRIKGGERESRLYTETVT